MPLASLATWLLCLPSLVLTCYSSEYPLLLFLLVFGEKELVRYTFVPGYILNISKRNMALRIATWAVEDGRMDDPSLILCWQRERNVLIIQS